MSFLHVLFIALLLVGFTSPLYAGATKVNICHRPPDNPTNVQIISINENAYDTHMAHGDTLVGPEVCDGIDNDCNGLIDDGVADMVSGTNVGECQQEIQSCQGGAFVVTQTGIGPTTEVCDGLDNDCDGTVDGPAAAQNSCDDMVNCTVDVCDSGMCKHEAEDSLCGPGEACGDTGCVATMCPCSDEILALGWETLRSDPDCALETVRLVCTSVGASENRQFVCSDRQPVGLVLEVGSICRVQLEAGTEADPLTPAQAEICIQTLFTDPGAASACLAN